MKSGGEAEVEKVRIAYDEFADVYDRRYSGLQGEYYKKLEERYVLRYCRFFGKKVLDLGTGTGRFAFSLSDTAESVVGVDISKKMINIAISKIEREKYVDFLVMDGRYVGIKDDYFDVVVSIGTFEYVKNFQSFLREIRRVLRPNGELIFTCHNVISLHLTKFIRKKTRYFYPARHSINDIKRQLQLGGFRLVDYYSTFYFPGFMVWDIYEILSSDFLRYYFIKAVVFLNVLLSRIKFIKRFGGQLIVYARTVQ